jgi:hypothetical protein
MGPNWNPFLIFVSSVKLFFFFGWVCVNWSFFCIGLHSDITFVFNNKTQKSGQMGEKGQWWTQVLHF